MIDDMTSATAAAASSAPTASGLGGLDGDAFLQLMVAQLRYQDPMAPSDPAAMMQQTSVMAQTEMIQQLAQVQQQLLGLQQAATASNLVGTEITAQVADGTQVTGVVEAVRFTSSGPALVVDGNEVPFAATSELRA